VIGRPNAFRKFAAHFFRKSFLMVFLLSVVMFFAASCKKKSAPASSLAIRNISREFVFAARNASGGHSEVSMRPEYAPRQLGKQATLLADDIFITVPLVEAGVADRATRDAIEAELGRVAEYHHLQRMDRPGAYGLERFDYFLNGRRIQSVHLITPIAGPQEISAISSARHPRLAVVIDDLGYDRTQADALFRLSYALTLSVLPHEANSGEIAEEAHRRGYEVMLHLPMASNAGSKDETIELQPGMGPADVEKTFSSMLETVPYAQGVNNHEGSLGTSDQKLMGELMPLLRQHNLFFIDSRTSAATIAESSAHLAGVATARRNVFLDDEQTVEATKKQFALAIRDAKQKGSALAIGHPHPSTMVALAEMLPEAERQGVRLVFASDLAR
jgi:uncharacterized protein